MVRDTGDAGERRGRECRSGVPVRCVCQGACANQCVKGEWRIGFVVQVSVKTRRLFMLVYRT